jgi:hypothetical protein
MANDQEESQTTWLDHLTRLQKQSSYAMFGVGGALLVTALFVIVEFKWEGAVEALASAGFGLVLLVGGYWHLAREPEQLTDRDATRILVLVVGGLLGFFITVIGFARSKRWWKYFTGGVETWQGEGSWRIWLCIFLIVGGLAVLFFSLMLARTEERSNPILRRLLYGYNAVLTGLLLLGALVLVNIMASIWLPPFADWTASGIYTLSSRSKSVLENLEQPVKVYVLLSHGDAAGEVKNLLDNCQEVSKKLTVEKLSFHRDGDRIRELIPRYQLLGEEGLLVVYGTAPDETHQFIKLSTDLFEQDPTSRRDRPRFVFKGEDALISAIDYLKSGKAKIPVYFTQGHGELDIDDSSTGKLDKGAGLLKDRLQKSNYEVKGLTFSATATTPDTTGKTVLTNRVPDDAAVVIVAGPRQPLSADALSALREYMSPKDPKKKNGKLVVFLDVVVQNDAMVQTGLEGFLAQFNVEVGNNRILTVANRQIIRMADGTLKEMVQLPQRIRISANPQQVNVNPVAKAFEDLVLQLYDCRTVRPMAAASASRGNYQVDSLFLTRENDIWVEDNLSDPVSLANDYYHNRLSELKSKLSREPLPVAVAVTESGPPDAMDPTRRSGASPPKPRMIVFGDATVACNEYMKGARTDVYSLIASSLAWLRERPENIGIEAKKREYYIMDPNANISRMIWLPFGLMMFSVVGLGLGVWVVRRR